MEQQPPHSIEPRTRRGRFRDPQRGNTLVVALIALTGLATLGAMTISSVEGGISSGTAERFHHIALYAAESGCGAGLDFLREASHSQYNWFSNSLRANNSGAETPPALRGNERLPGQSGNPFSANMSAWYRVTLYNNQTDRNFEGTYGSPDSLDSDGRVFLLCEGHGPSNAVASIMVEVQGVGSGPAQVLPPPPAPQRQLLPAPPRDLDDLVILSWREVE